MCWRSLRCHLIQSVYVHLKMADSESVLQSCLLLCFLLFSSFAATKNELHDFSPDKEPLLSMLEGEIQTMYMCKPGGCVPAGNFQ